MQERICISGRCFDCNVQQVAGNASSLVVKTHERRYFRFTGQAAALFSAVGAVSAIDERDPQQRAVLQFFLNVLVPRHIYREAGTRARAPARNSRSTLAWHREVLPQRVVQRVATVLAPAFNPVVLPWLLTFALATNVWFVWHNWAHVSYDYLLTYDARELVAIVLLAIATGLLHELGHSAACLHYAGSTGPIGVGFFFVTPVFYSDVSDVHLLGRRQKAMVGIAGVCFELAFTACAVWLMPGSAVVQKFVWIALLGVVFTLLPFYRNDGFWILNDLTGSTNLLRESAAAIRSGTGRAWHFLYLLFVIAFAAGLLIAAAKFALEAGPQQIARTVSGEASFSAAVRALLIALQYGALGFAIHAVAGWVWKMAAMRFTGR